MPRHSNDAITRGVHRAGRSTPGASEQARKTFLAKLSATPSRAMTSILRDMGYSDTIIEYWKGSDPKFWPAVQRIRRIASGERPPDPGDFISFRRQFLNIKVENPYTTREGWEGVTYEFQRPFCEAISDPERRRIITLHPVRHGKCGWVEAPVSMADGTTRRHGDVAEGDMVVGRTGPTRVVAAQDNGTVTVLRIRTEHGRELYVTPNHPILTPCGWVPAAEIAGHTIRAAGAFGSNHLPADEARFLGMMIGDGSLSSGNCGFTKGDPVLLAEAERFATERGWGIRQLPGRGCTEYRFSGGARSWARDYGIYGCTSRTKFVPDAVMRGDHATAVAFLSGLFATDGTITDRDRWYAAQNDGRRPVPRQESLRIEWTFASQRLTRDVQELLTRMGVGSHLSVRWHTGREYWRLSVTGDRAWLLLSQLPVFGEKSTRARKWADAYIPRSFPGPVTDRVVGVDDLGERPTVALQTEDGTYVTGGVVTHNTTIVEHMVIWYLCKNPNARVILICSNYDHAEERLQKIRTILEDEDLYPELHQTWGPWITKPEGRGKPWTRRKLYIRGHTGSARSPSIRVFGISARVYGARADLGILDDVDDPEAGPKERKDIVAKINGAIVSRLDAGGKLVYIGTRCGHQDVAIQFVRNPKYWADVQRADRPIVNSDGVVVGMGALCPELYTAEDLASFREEIGDALYELMYNNNPSAADTMVFPPELIDLSKSEFSALPIEEDDRSNWVIYASLDPSLAERAALVVVAFDPRTKRSRVIDCEIRLAPRHDGVFTMIQNAVFTHRPDYFVVEEAGTTFITELPHVIEFLYDEHVEPIRFATGRNKHDFRLGVPLVAKQMAHGRLKIAWADDLSRRKMRPLIDDMLAFKPYMSKGQNYDAVMALWFAVNTIYTDDQFKRGRNQTVVDPIAFARPRMLAERGGVVDPLGRRAGVAG